MHVVRPCSPQDVAGTLVSGGAERLGGERTDKAAPIGDSRARAGRGEEESGGSYPGAWHGTGRASATRRVIFAFPLGPPCRRAQPIGDDATLKV